MGNLWRDVRYGLRKLANNKGFAAVAILALALGIGPNVAIFSIIWATFLAPLPYPDADQLVVVWTKVRGERSPSRTDDYLQYLAQSRSFQNLDFGAWKVLHLTNPDHSQDETTGLPATPGYFTKNQGVRIALGRDFLPEEGVPGKDHEVILTHRVWLERFHGDPAILGKPILIDDQPYTVVGVLEAGVRDRVDGVQFGVPLALTPGMHTPEWGNIFGRLKRGVTIAQAQAELSVIDRQLAATRSGDLPKNAWTISVEPLKNDWMDKKLARNLWLLLAAVGFVLLIACANLANLLLAKGSSRQQELAVRAAMGATRRQVFGQLITESLTLAILGGAVGIALGWAILKLAMAILPNLGTAEAVIQLNLPVLYFALGATFLAGVLFGCLPAWQAARFNLSETLKQGSRSVTGRGRMRTQGLLVMAEFALALTLLAGAGMALHSFWNLTQIDFGVRTDNIVTGWLETRRHDFTNPDQISADARQLLDKVRSLPGLQNATIATNMPLNGNGSFPFSIVGHPVAVVDRPVADYQIVTPSYFETFGVRLARGRLLNDNDRAGSPQVIIVSQSFVDRFLHGVNPLDQRLLLGKLIPNQKIGPASEWQIVGVFHDIHNGQHLGDKAAPQIFASYWQIPWPWTWLAVRTALDPGPISASIRDVVAHTLTGHSFAHVRTMQQVVNTQMTGDRFGMVLFGGFAVLALLLSALGIYGVMAFAVVQRSHEIGLRMALGAQQGDVVRLILADGMKLSLTGVGIGLVGVFALGHLMRTTLYGIKTIDAGSFAAVAIVLLAVAVLASYVPARRSARVDPMIALRQE
jgi:putative ABC transport system permease protein